MNRNDYLAEIINIPDHPFFKRQDLLCVGANDIPDSFHKCRKDKFTFLKREVWSEVFKQMSLLKLDNYNSIERKISDDGEISVSSPFIVQESILSELVELLTPWRKGPWKFNEFIIDAEWKSNIKYSDIASVKHLLNSKRILDIGGGNGYYAIRAILDLADSAIIFDPSEKFFFQFELVQKFLQEPRVQYEIGGYLEALQTKLTFDVVFCLGVFYHQKHPLELIESCWKQMEKGGALFLESMIIDGDKSELFFPPDRYAKARNVYFLPTIEALYSILKRSGFANIELISVRETSFEEQRKTKHMPFESLESFIDQNDKKLTVEGFQRPKRALLIARK